MSACGGHYHAPAVPAHFPDRFLISRWFPSRAFQFDIVTSSFCVTLYSPYPDITASQLNYLDISTSIYSKIAYYEGIIAEQWAC